MMTNIKNKKSFEMNKYTFIGSTGRGKKKNQEPIVGTGDWQTICGVWGHVDPETSTETM